MKEHVETIVSQFTDFKGLIHHFVIAAYSMPLTKLVGGDFIDVKELQNSKTWMEVNTFIENYGIIDSQDVTKGLCIGISICNPEDKFDELIGIKKAISRAKNSYPVLYVTKSGIINTTMVKALLEQEAKYLASNPENYIAGYADAKERYENDLKMQEELNNTDELDYQVMKKMKEDSSWINKLLSLVKWQKQRG